MYLLIISTACSHIDVEQPQNIGSAFYRIATTKKSERSIALNLMLWFNHKITETIK